MNHAPYCASKMMRSYPQGFQACNCGLFSRNRRQPVPAQAMRVGPNTDAVVWKLCDTNETVEL